jgi:GNAT superfamily N-acetyltransferase
VSIPLCYVGAIHETMMGAMPLCVRPALPTDRHALIEQYLGLNRHEEPIVHNRVTTYAGAVESLADAEERLARAGGVALVAELDGRVVGHLFLEFRQDPVYVRPELRRYAYVSELFVRDEARRCGAGAALMHEAERIAVGRGIGRLMVDVLAGNAVAEAFYARSGFTAYAIELGKAIGPAS